MHIDRCTLWTCDCDLCRKTLCVLVRRKRTAYDLLKLLIHQHHITLNREGGQSSNEARQKTTCRHLLSNPADKGKFTLVVPASLNCRHAEHRHQVFVQLLKLSIRRSETLYQYIVSDVRYRDGLYLVIAERRHLLRGDSSKIVMCVLFAVANLGGFCGFYMTQAASHFSQKTFRICTVATHFDLRGFLMPGNAVVCQTIGKTKFCHAQSSEEAKMEASCWGDAADDKDHDDDDDDDCNEASEVSSVGSHL